MFKNKVIKDTQTFKDEEVRFDPDSSPAAWAHYQQFYSHNNYLSAHYDFQKLFFYNYYEDFGLETGYCDGYDRFDYVNKPLKDNTYNRLFVLEKGTKTEHSENIEFIAATNRLGGDCDFNFNKKKYAEFTEIIQKDNTSSEKEKTEATTRLARCKKMHYSLLNFSLIQAIGNLQKFKGRIRFDRFDTFLCKLDEYYHGISDEIFRCSSRNNKPALISFLNDFKDIYEYCAIFYFITDKRFVDEIIEQGSMPITNVKELVRYMNLAEKYWFKKEVELKNYAI